jgi:hypothetical protein
MKKYSSIAACAAIVVVFATLSLWAGDTVKISRITAGIAGQGSAAGSVSTSGLGTYTVSTSPTNEYTIEVVNSAVAATSPWTSVSNTFTKAYVAAPTVVYAPKSGVRLIDQTIAISNVTITVTTTNLIVSGMTSNAPINDITVLLYGYKRTGIISQ